jgi:hypothetical protein
MGSRGEHGGHWLRWAAVAAAGLAIGVVPVAHAKDELPRFTGKCVPAGPANLIQRGSLQKGIYFDLPVSCTGTLGGARVTGKAMHFFLAGWPAAVNCRATSVAQADSILTDPAGGGRAKLGNDTGVMRIANTTRTLSFTGDHITTPLGVGSVGTVNAAFKFSPPPPGACGTGVTAVVSVTGSLNAT